MISIHAVREVEALNELEPDWNRLLSMSKTQSPFLTFEWITSWWKHYGKGKELMVLVAVEDSEVIGIAPLMKDRVVQFIGTPLSDYSDMVISRHHDEVMAEFLHFLSDETLDLTQVPADSTLQALDGTHLAKQQSIARSLVFDEDSPRIIGELWKRLRRRVNSKFEKGILEMRELTKEDEVLDGIDIMVNWHVSRMDALGEKTYLKDRRFKPFLKEVCLRLKEKGMLSLWSLLYRGKKIGCHCGFMFNNKYVYYTQSYDNGYKSLSPGNAMLTWLIGYTHDNWVSEFDFGRGDEPYKKRFTNSAKKTTRFVLTQSTVSHIAAEVKLRMHDLVRQHAGIYRFLRRYEDILPA
jgi:CelD/BcsL family acetyltransferase involved in cellulose biosynthesis